MSEAPALHIGGCFAWSSRSRMIRHVRVSATLAHVAGHQASPLTGTEILDLLNAGRLTGAARSVLVGSGGVRLGGFRLDTNGS